MENKEILEALKKIVPQDRIKQNELMKKHTSFKIGGPAEFFIKIEKTEEIMKLLKFIDEHKIKLTIVGNGSNLLVSDKGIDGIVVKIGMSQITIKDLKNNKKEVEVDSGVLIGTLGYKLLEEEITGFEEFCGIPGTIGGATTMNAGAYGKEIKDIITEVIAIDYKGNLITFNSNQLDFSYRNSRFLREKYIILKVKLILDIGKKENIKSKMQELADLRKEKQPIENPSAGSTFKRGDDFITAQLIDQAGLKGYTIGGAQVSTKHAGFIVNIGNATSKDVLDLAKFIEEEIYKQFGKKIELEIKVI